MDKDDLKDLASCFPDFSHDLISALRAVEALQADRKGVKLLVSGEQSVDVPLMSEK
jgi:hypothetical protein